MSVLDRFGLGKGNNAHFPSYVESKIRVANYVIILLFMIMAGYAGFSFFFYPALTWLPASAFVVLLVTLGLIMNGEHLVYRSIICLLPMVVATCYHGYLAQPGDSPIPSIWLFQMAFLLLPLMLFDRRERAFQAGATFVSIIAILSFDPINNALDTPLDDSLFREGPMHYMTAGFALVMGVAAIAIMSETNYTEQMKVGSLLSKSEEQGKALLSRENEMRQQMETLEQNRIEEERRTWASEGQALFARLIRQHEGQALYDRLIAEMVRIMKANQGGIYVWEEEKECLDLRSAYGYDRKKHMSRSYEPGQGLLGQCYLERDIIYMTEVPQGYTYITSGLGLATPAAILLVPLIHDEEVAGVVELASFSPFESYQQEFLQKLGEDLAASISTQRMQETTKVLLAEAQSQAEEMRAQEEEMRQNMEELSATQEEMQRKEMEYLRRIEELEGSLNQVDAS